MAISIDNSLTIQDRIRLHLGEYGNKYVPTTVDDLAGKLGERPYTVYQALYRLQSLGEVEFDKESKDGRKAKIIGITVNKLEPSGRTYERAAERGKASITKVTPEDYAQRMVHLTAYMNQKLAVYAMQDTAKEAGLDPEFTVKFEPNPVAEEGLLLLQLVTDLNQKLTDTRYTLEQTEYDLAAERRNVRYLKGERQEETRRELIASATN